MRHLIYKRELNMKLATRIIATACTAGLAAVVWTTSSAGRSAGNTEAVADAAPGYAVENYDYPNADKILAEKNIVLKRGDGHIVLADCAGETGLLEVWARS
ncbi:hypothetical protein AB0M40_38945, partial [Streptomyces hydrogenans]